MFMIVIYWRFIDCCQCFLFLLPLYEWKKEHRSFLSTRITSTTTLRVWKKLALTTQTKDVMKERSSKSPSNSIQKLIWSLRSFWPYWQCLCFTDRVFVFLYVLAWSEDTKNNVSSKYIAVFSVAIYCLSLFLLYKHDTRSNVGWERANRGKTESKKDRIEERQGQAFSSSLTVSSLLDPLHSLVLYYRKLLLTSMIRSLEFRVLSLSFLLNMPSICCRCSGRVKRSISTKSI